MPLTQSLGSMTLGNESSCIEFRRKLLNVMLAVAKGIDNIPRAAWLSDCAVALAASPPLLVHLFLENDAPVRLVVMFVPSESKEITPPFCPPMIGVVEVVTNVSGAAALR